MVIKMQPTAQSDVPDTRRKRRPTFQLFIYENPCIQYHYSIQRQRDMQSPVRLPGRQLHQYNKFAVLIPYVRHIIDIKFILNAIIWCSLYLLLRPQPHRSAYAVV